MNLTSLGAWHPLLEEEIKKPYFIDLMAKVSSAYEKGDPRIFPSQEDLFNAFQLTTPDKVKCVICGQDPYPTYGHAHGLSFSVPPGFPIPKSLQNIFKELQSDLGCSPPNNGCLEHWAKEGVFLLNTVLTVYEGQPDSHKSWGWQTFTQAVLEHTRDLPQPIVFILWGSKAQKSAVTASILEATYPRLSLSSAHPSPLGAHRGFWNSKPFSKANDFLVANGSQPINWQIPNL